MTGEEKKTLTRRQLLGGMGKLAYVAPALTVLSLGTDNTHAFSAPCPPNDGCDATGGVTATKQKPRIKSRRKQRKK